MQTATVHALPSCNHERIFQLRHAAAQAGATFVRTKPRAVAHKPAPIDPNDGGRAA